MPGSSAAPPRSTCATCSGRAWPAATAPGRWPPDQAAGPPGRSLQRIRPAAGRGSGPGTTSRLHLSADGLAAGPAQKRRPGYADPHELAFFSRLLELHLSILDGVAARYRAPFFNALR